MATTTRQHLTLIKETDRARYYENARGYRQWVPRSVCPRVLKMGQVHEVYIEDWWLEQNPWTKPAGQQPGLL